MPQLLLVEDDPAIRTALTRALTERGHGVRSASTGMAGLQAAVEDRPDLVVLDLGLPDVDGCTLLAMLRAVSDVPVIVATARDDEAEIVRALDAGADDYVVEAVRCSAPRRAREGRAAPQRHRGGVPRPPVGGLRVDLAAREVVLDGRALELTRLEFDLLAHLAARPGTVVTKRELLADVWHAPYGGADKTVDVHLSWLRRKLGRVGRRSPLPAQRARGRGEAGRAVRRRPRCCAVRRQLVLLATATTLLVVVAFLLPLALLLRTLAADRPSRRRCRRRRAWRCWSR